MARPRQLPKPAIVLTWKLDRILDIHVLVPSENEWKVADALLDRYPEATHVCFYGEVNGLTRTECIEEVRKLEQSRAS